MRSRRLSSHGRDTRRLLLLLRADGNYGKNKERNSTMKKALVAYFSASGTTKRLSMNLADVIGADLFEITPEIPYTEEDLNWQNPSSRSSVEMNDRSCRPAIAAKVTDMSQYDLIFVGFPVWWYREPSIIDTFAESYDFSGKTLIPFATSSAFAAFLNMVEPLSIEAACSNPVAVGPGQKAVTVTPVPFTSSETASEKLRTNSFVA